MAIASVHYDGLELPGSPIGFACLGVRLNRRVGLPWQGAFLMGLGGGG